MRSGFTGWQTVALVAVCVSPFWFLASNLKDLSELKSTGVGASIALAVGAVFKGIERLRK